MLAPPIVVPGQCRFEFELLLFPFGQEKGEAAIRVLHRRQCTESGPWSTVVAAQLKRICAA